MKDNFQLNVLGTLANKDFEQAFGNFTETLNKSADYGLDCGYHGYTKRWCYVAKANQAKCPGSHDYSPTGDFKNTALKDDLYYSYAICGEKKEAGDRRLATNSQTVTCSSLKQAYHESGCPTLADTKEAKKSACCQCAGDMLLGAKDGFVANLYKATTNTDYSVAWQAFVQGQDSEHSASYGLTCDDHDKNIKTCKAGKTNADASWCLDSWCYLTNAACPGSTKTGAFAGTAMENYLNFSYTHCKDVDKKSDSMCGSGGGSSGGSSGEKENGARGFAVGLVAVLVVAVANL